MTRYPALADAVGGVDLVELSHCSGVGVESIEALLDAAMPASLSVKMRLAEALGADPRVLFRLAPELEVAMGDVVAQGHPRYVSDPTALRAIEHVGGRSGV